MEDLDTTNGLETVAAEKSEIKASESLHQNPEVNHATTTTTNDVQVQCETRGVKRPAEDDDDEDEDEDEDRDDDNPGLDSNGNGDVDITTETTPLSKNQLKKLKRQKRWEEKKQYLKETRKDKRRGRRERKKQERQAEIDAAAAEGKELTINQPPKRDSGQKTQVPVTVIIDCQFEKYMMDKELVSLCSQVTRCYSDNRTAKFPVHIFVSSYGGAMKTRFETTLVNMHQNWKGIHFRDGDFIEVAKEAKELMAGPQGGKTIKLFEKNDQGDSVSLVQPPPPPPPPPPPQDSKDSREIRKPKKSIPAPEPEADDVDKSIVYLTADSPYTLERLEPNTSYVIGGIIDKNREKGLCYKLAREKKVRTAKLPIGEFMVMQSRHILATNHVMDIFLKYLELGDWGAAFMKVIPPRKGGILKDDDANTEADHGEEVKEDDNSRAGKAEAVTEKEQEDSEMQEAVAEEKGPDAEVEGATSEDGLQKNALGEKEWSAPPVEREKVPDLENATVEPEA